MAQRSMMLIEDICRAYGIGISLYLVQDDPMQMSLSRKDVVHNINTGMWNQLRRRSLSQRPCPMDVLDSDRQKERQ